MDFRETSSTYYDKWYYSRLSKNSDSLCRVADYTDYADKLCKQVFYYLPPEIQQKLTDALADGARYLIEKAGDQP